MERHGEDNLAFHDDSDAVRADMLKAMKQVAKAVAHETGDDALVARVRALGEELGGTSPSVDALMMLEKAVPGSIEQALSLIHTLHEARHKKQARRTRIQRIGNGLLNADRLAWNGVRSLFTRNTDGPSL